jgi:hypothetical protein
MAATLEENINALGKTEMIRRRADWRNCDAVKLATLEWGDWFSSRRLVEPIHNNAHPLATEVRSDAVSRRSATTHSKRDPKPFPIENQNRIFGTEKLMNFNPDPAKLRIFLIDKSVRARC